LHPIEACFIKSKGGEQQPQPGDDSCKKQADGVTGKNKELSFMKSLQILAIAVAAGLPFSLHAQSVSQDTSSTADAGQQEAMLMVPANGELLRTIDAGNIESGSQFKVKLAQTVHLDSGPELHSGSILVGTVTKDSEQGSAPKLTLRFTQATLKDGTVVPIKATIVGVARPEVDDSQGYSVTPGNQRQNDWTSGTLQVEQLNAASHADLHSEIASDDSGVFISRDNHNVKIPAGSELELAIAKGNN
jgi:hypothetical protein